MEESITELRAEARHLLLKKRNRPVAALVAALEQRIQEAEAHSQRAARDLSMNTGIMDRNFDGLVAVLKSLDEAIQAISSGIVSPTGAVARVNEASDTMRANASTMEMIIEGQASATVEFTATLEEISASIRSVSEMAQSARTNVQALVKAAELGNSLVQGSRSSIEEIRDASSQITSIIKVIQGISGQSNLLAMNAAIEAAHAGEHGRGFAVVAEEMRSLSENTTREAKNISSIIRTVAEKIEASSAAAERMIENNATVEQEILAMDTMIAELGMAMEEQSAGTTQVLGVVEDLNNRAGQTRDASAKQKAAVELLDSTVDELNTTATGIRNVMRLQDSNRNQMVEIINKVGRSFLRTIGVVRHLEGRDS